jgi:hypothetical protein
MIKNVYVINEVMNISFSLQMQVLLLKITF